MTITSSFTGNLGNHMFIYALTRTVAEKNGYDWGFNPTPEFDYYNGKSQMDFIDIDYGKIHNYTYNNRPPWIKYVWKEYYQNIRPANGDNYDYHPYQSDVFNIADDTILYIRCMQDARYYDREKLRRWFKIKQENKGVYKASLREFGIDIEQDNVCIINIRGGEYKGVPNLLLRKKYWEDAIAIMKKRNSLMRFLCITDDEGYANKLLDFKIPVTHLSIGGDYYILNKAKNLIISNSSFGIFPTWLNKNDPFVIAPMFWARHNVSEGYWANSDIWTFPWNFLGRNGVLHEK
jgi:hypothetical protein